MDGTTWKIPYQALPLIVGFMVLIAGFSFAMFSERRDDVRASVARDSGEYTKGIMTEYGKGDGVVHIPSMLADPYLSRLGDDISERPARVTITLPDDTSYVFYHPSRGSFDGSGSLSETFDEHVLVDMGDGRRLPGSMEVTVVEG